MDTCDQQRHTRHPVKLNYLSGCCERVQRTDATSWVVTNGHTSHLSGGHPKPAQVTQVGLGCNKTCVCQCWSLSFATWTCCKGRTATLAQTLAALLTLAWHKLFAPSQRQQGSQCLQGIVHNGGRRCHLRSEETHKKFSEFIQRPGHSLHLEKTQRCLNCGARMLPPCLASKTERLLDSAEGAS